MQDYEIKPSLIRSRAAISYGEADSAIADESHKWHPTLRPLSNLAQALLALRERAGAINVNREEMVIKVTSPTDIDVRVVARNTPARDLVSEMMVLCNSLMADYCKVHNIPGVLQVAVRARRLRSRPVRRTRSPSSADPPSAIPAHATVFSRRHQRDSDSARRPRR